MQIESILHKALRRFAETGQPKGLPADSVDRLRRMLAYIDAFGTAEELRVPPNFGAQYTRDFREAFVTLAGEHDVAFIPFMLAGVAGDAA